VRSLPGWCCSHSGIAAGFCRLLNEFTGPVQNAHAIADLEIGVRQPDADCAPIRSLFGGCGMRPHRPHETLAGTNRCFWIGIRKNDRELVIDRSADDVVFMSDNR
jgi:hypothetical protein